MEFLIIFAVLMGIFGLIFLIRYLVNAGRLAKAKKLAAAGQRGQALGLFLKTLRFQLGSADAPQTLDHVLDLYRGAGYGDADLGKIKDKYMQLHDEFKSDLKELDSRKMKSKQKTDAVSRLDKDYKERFGKEFVPILPKLN
jgi:hypothetical protein